MRYRYDNVIWKNDNHETELTDTKVTTKVLQVYHGASKHYVGYMLRTSYY
jgi:hypothetical protein